jgi:hypothetical protein
MTRETALAEIERNIGTQFCPQGGTGLLTMLREADSDRAADAETDATFQAGTRLTSPIRASLRQSVPRAA